MKKTQEQKVETQTQVVIFGDKIENKKMDLKKFVQIIRTKFEPNHLEVGKIAYYSLALRQKGLVDFNYTTLVDIIHKIFELNNLETDTTEKCMAYYQNKINKGLINIDEPFKTSSRTRQKVDISYLFE